ncbi:heavy-metal-associated domain-containing protein [Streptomyces sp. Wb2n-11]|uniref:heavy-metal-associated domain-containing protein n=1 Tax=Streptomyces sp. Wb2n-11 TaxID=1030533 RepID=UPI000B80FB21|nr:heavy-metal-associated domain-containing protein [Streptomyces sp. Wb2n-11]
MSSYTTVCKIDGAHSGHCRAVVSKALGELESTVAVRFDLSTGRAAVTTTAEPDDALIAEKTDDAGYDFVGRA